MDRRRCCLSRRIAAAGRVFHRNFNLSPEAVAAAFASGPWGGRELVRYPQKTDLILLTDWPPQLETPLRYFQSDLTPNQAFFVRWHLSGIPTSIDLREFRLEVGGHVQKP